MSKVRIILAGSALLGLTALPAAFIPASAASTTNAAPANSPSANSPSGSQSNVSNSSGGPLLSVCLTVTPKSLAVGINGQNIVIGPAGVPRSCLHTPF